MRRLIALTLLAAGPASADALSACRSIDNDGARLACFDALPTDAALAAPILAPSPSASAPAPASAGNWQVSTETNPLDDSKTVVATLEAGEGRGQFGTPVALIVRCEQNRTEAYVHWNGYLGNDGDYRNEYKRVQVRIGSDAAETQRWSLSTTSKATFAPKPIPFLRALAQADRLVMETVPYNANPVTAVFTLTGLREALAPVAETCGWSFEAG